MFLKAGHGLVETLKVAISGRGCPQHVDLPEALVEDAAILLEGDAVELIAVDEHLGVLLLHQRCLMGSSEFACI